MFEMFQKIIDVTNGVYICKNRVLLLQRKWNYEFAGQWCTPGGKVEANESIEDSMIREFFEETNIKNNNWKFFLTSCNRNYRFHHFLHKIDEDFPTVVISTKEHVGFGWFLLDELSSIKITNATYDALSTLFLSKKQENSQV